MTPVPAPRWVTVYMFEVEYRGQTLRVDTRTRDLMRPEVIEYCEQRWLYEYQRQVGRIVKEATWRI